MTSSLRSPLTKSTHGTPTSRANRRIAVANPSEIVPNGAVEAIGNPSWRCTNATNPAGYCSPGTYTLRYIRSMHSTSKAT
jgi:hypothetical protein